MKKLKPLFYPFVFFLFICFLIIQADLDKENLLIYVGHHIPFGDKIAHFVLYGLLALLINISLKFKTVSTKLYTFYLGSIGVISFAIIEEFSQLAFESRTFDLIDILADCIGIVLLSSPIFRSLLKKQLLSIIHAIS